MPILNLPTYSFDILQGENGKNSIYDEIRKRYVSLTPEEWVRQNFVSFLVREKNVPIHRIENEQTISLFNTSKRCDSVIYALNSIPLAIVEYKAPHVSLTQKVFEQIGRYNIVLQVRFLIVSNGLTHYIGECDYTSKKIAFLRSIPSYGEMLLRNQNL